MKKFKAGKYYIFNKNGKKIDRAEIHALVPIDGVLHAVFTYYTDVIKHVRTLPVEIEGETQTIHFTGAGWYLNADAPVALKPAKFKVGKKYYYFFDENDEGKRFITARYKDPIDGRLKVVFGDEVYEIYTDQDGNETIDFCNGELNAKNEVKE